MRKFTLLTLFLFMCVFIRATTCVDFITRYVPNKPIGNSTPKTPMRPPVVYYVKETSLTDEEIEAMKADKSQLLEHVRNNYGSSQE